jgi:hypothetical protein
VRELPNLPFLFRPDLLCPDDAALLAVGCKHVDSLLPPIVDRRKPAFGVVHSILARNECALGNRLGILRLLMTSDRLVPREVGGFDSVGRNDRIRHFSRFDRRGRSGRSAPRFNSVASFSPTPTGSRSKKTSHNRNRATTSTPNCSAHLRSKPLGIKRTRRRNAPKPHVYQHRHLRHLR